MARTLYVLSFFQFIKDLNVTYAELIPQWGLLDRVEVSTLLSDKTIEVLISETQHGLE